MGNGADGSLARENRPMVTLGVLDHGELTSISFDDLVKYHGRNSVGGVAHAFKVMERALPLLDDGKPPERYEIEIQTPFPGPGARDAFEMVTRAVTGARYQVEPGLGRDAPEAPEGRYFFRFTYRSTVVDLVMRAGHVSDEFIALVRRPSRTADEERHLARLKGEMADRLMSLPAAEVYDASVVSASENADE